MVAVVIIDDEHGLRVKCVIETNLIRVSYHCISHYFHFNISFKQLYTSNKMERLNYKGGCSMCRHMRIEVFKRRLAWAIDKQLQVASNKYYLKQLYH